MEIKEYNSNFFNSFVSLIDKSFWIKNKDKIWLIKWKFFDNPNNDKNKIVCSYFDDKIVGQYSNISKSFWYKDEIINGYLCQDMCILKDFRWKWLISKMSKYLYSNISESTFSIWFSNKQWVKVDRNSKQYWYKVIDNFKTYILATFLNNKNTYIFKKIISLDDLKNIDFDKFDLFSEYIKNKNDYNYIKWRYFDKPNNDYNFFLIYNDLWKIVWYVIFRFKKWFWIIYDFNTIKKIDNKIFIWTLKQIWYLNKCYFIRIQLILNGFWTNFFKDFLKFKLNENIYFTAKNHNWFNKINILDKENWIIVTWDIL